MKTQGKQLYLWRAVDQDSDVLDILVTKRWNKRAAKRFFRKVLTWISHRAMQSPGKEDCSAFGHKPFIATQWEVKPTR